MAINNKPLGSPNSPTDLTQTLPNGSGGTESVAAALVDHNTTEENFQEALLHTATQVDQTQIDLGYPEPGATRPGTVDSRLDALESGTVTPTAMSGADVTGPANNLQIQPLAVGTPELGLHAVTGGEMGKIAENTVTNRELANTDVRFNIGDNTTPVTATLGAADADLNAIPVFNRTDDGVVPNAPTALADDHRVLNDDGNWRKIESWALSETELIPSHRVEATGEARGNYATTTAMANAAETARTTTDPWQPNDTATVTDSGTSQVTTYVFLGYPSASGTPTSISNFSALGSVDSYGAGLGLSLDSTSNQFSVTTPTFAAGTNYFYRGMSSGGSNVLEWRTDAQARGDLGLGNVQNVNWTTTQAGLPGMPGIVNTDRINVAAANTAGILNNGVAPQNISGTKTFLGDVTLGNATTNTVTVPGHLSLTDNVGSLTNPTVDFTHGGGSAGIHSNADNELTFGTNSTRALRLDSSQNTIISGNLQQNTGTDTRTIFTKDSTNLSNSRFNSSYINYATVQNRAPQASEGKEGDLWYDTVGELLYVKDSTTWQEAGGGSGSITYNGSPPAEPEPGDLWFDCDADNARIFIWTGNEWIDACPAGTDEVPSAALFSDTAPTTSLTDGYLWYDTSIGRLFVYSEDRGAWIDAAPAAADDNIGVTQLDGITDNPTEAMNVQANTDGTFSLVEAGTGGIGGTGFYRDTASATTNNGQIGTAFNTGAQTVGTHALVSGEAFNINSNGANSQRGRHYLEVSTDNNNWTIVTQSTDQWQNPPNGILNGQAIPAGSVLIRTTNSSTTFSFRVRTDNISLNAAEVRNVSIAVFDMTTF